MRTSVRTPTAPSIWSWLFRLAQDVSANPLFGWLSISFVRPSNLDRIVCIAGDDFSFYVVDRAFDLERLSASKKVMKLLKANFDLAVVHEVQQSGKMFMWYSLNVDKRVVLSCLPFENRFEVD